jgi:hypothetical protein
MAFPILFTSYLFRFLRGHFLEGLAVGLAGSFAGLHWIGADRSSFSGVGPLVGWLVVVQKNEKTSQAWTLVPHCISCLRRRMSMFYSPRDKKSTFLDGHHIQLGVFLMSIFLSEHTLEVACFLITTFNSRPVQPPTPHTL